MSSPAPHPVIGASPAHYMDNESRRGFAIALQAVERWMELSNPKFGPGATRNECRALLVCACDRKTPTDATKLRPLALFVLN